MTCPVCSEPSTGDLCASCTAKTSRIRPAGKFLVDRAARRTMRLASGLDAPETGLVDYTISGYPAGRRW